MNNKNLITLQGFSGDLEGHRKIIQELIPKFRLKKGISDDEILVIYSGIKRQFLLNLFNTNKLDNLKELTGGRVYFALETMVSRDLKDRIYDWFDNFDKRRGISWFYDYANHYIFDSIHPNDLRKIFQKALEKTHFTHLIDLLVEPEYFFETNENFNLSRTLFEKNPFSFFLSRKSKRKVFPPRFNFWDYKKPPSIGVVLVDNKGELFYHKPITGGLLSPKIIGMKLKNEDILLNFPFRWDNSANGFIFGRHSKNTAKFTEVGEAWSLWLKQRGLVLPNGPSGKIPNESTTAVYLEWMKRRDEFVERIIQDSNFRNFCEKYGFSLDKNNYTLISKEGNIFRLAKVSMDSGGRLRRLSSWKLFKETENSCQKIKSTLKALIYDITVQERNVNTKKIDNWEKWLKDNWLDEFESIKNYF